jgi:DNA-binding PadR family transcriptional regulator
MSPLQVTILEVIEANDGRFSWYQLTRALTHRAGGLDPAMVSKGLLPALHELEQAGFITTSAGPNPGQPVYSITPTGQQRLVRDVTGTPVVP